MGCISNKRRHDNSLNLVIFLFVSQVCYARVLDYRRKFVEAAQRYNELSYNTKIHETERMSALKHAFICTILASAGRCITFQTEKC